MMASTTRSSLSVLMVLSSILHGGCMLSLFPSSDPGYYKADISHLQPQPQWIKLPPLLLVFSASSCNDLTFPLGSLNIGFLYNPLTLICTPVSGFGTPGTFGVSAINDADGDLYLDVDLNCPDQFTLYFVDDQLVCLRVVEDVKNYADAGATCTSWSNSGLATVKTTDKLDLIVGLAPDTRLWIGLDDLATEGRYVYSSDGSVITSDQISSLFADDQPDNQDGAEDCVIIQDTGKMNDITCSSSRGFVCEIVLLS